MNYTVELNDADLKLLMSITIDEYRRVQSLVNEESSTHPIKAKAFKDLEYELLSLMEKLENVFTAADEIIGD